MNIPERIIQGLKRHEEDAFDFVYRTYSGLIHHVIFFMIHDDGYAEDLTQETFIHLMKHTDDLDPSKNLKFYMITIAKNLALDYLRTKRPDLLAGDAEEITWDDTSIVNDSKFTSLMETYRPYINAIEYDIVILRLYYDLSLKDIAEMKGRTPHAVESIYSRALHKLKKNARKEDFNE